MIISKSGSSSVLSIAISMLTYLSKDSGSNILSASGMLLFVMMRANYSWNNSSSSASSSHTEMLGFLPCIIGSRHQGIVCWIGLRWACRMHQTVSYFDWSVPLGLWFAALWFWIPGFRFQEESNKSWDIQLDMRLPGIYLVLFLQVLLPPWNILGGRTRSLGIRRCRVYLMWVLQEACVPVIWRQIMLSIALFLPRTGSHSTRVILGKTPGTWFDTIVSWVHGCIPWQDSSWIVAF